MIDGMVAAGERRRLVAHLAGCESCYAVFAGAAHALSRLAEATGDSRSPSNTHRPATRFGGRRGRIEIGSRRYRKPCVVSVWGV